VHLVSVDHGVVADVLEHLTITARQIAGASDTILGRHPVLGAVVLVLDAFVSVATLLSEIPLVGWLEDISPIRAQEALGSL
jgi:hypothetical protein